MSQYNKLLNDIKCNCTDDCPQGKTKGRCVIYTGKMIKHPITILPNTDLDTILNKLLKYIYEQTNGQDLVQIWNAIHDIQNNFSNYYTKTEIDQLLQNINADKNFVWNQSSPSTQWDITHNLNKLPSVTVMDTAGTILTCAIDFINISNVRLSFNSPTAGKATLN